MERLSVTRELTQFDRGWGGRSYVQPRDRRVDLLKKDMTSWPRIESLIKEIPRDRDVIAWKLVEELSVRAAKLLE